MSQQVGPRRIWTWLTSQMRRGSAPSPATSFGRRGEDEAAGYLRRKGFRIVGIRERTPLGELDLVALDGQTVVFVEVKTRRSAEPGEPLEAVGYRKQRQLTRLALSYLKRHQLLEHPARFDVVGVTWPADQRQPEIRHVANAFEPVGRWQMFS